MARTKLISNDEVRLHSIAKASFDVNKFSIHIIPAQEEYIMGFLGEDLFNELLEQTEADTLTEANIELIDDYIKPALAWFVLHKALPFIHSDIANVGIQSSNTEFSNSSASKERADLMAMCLNNGNTLLGTTERFLKNNEGTYPLYDNATDIDTTTEIIGGIILDEEESEDLNE